MFYAYLRHTFHDNGANLSNKVQLATFSLCRNRGSRSSRILFNVSHVKRLVVCSQSGVRASERGTDATASSRRFEDEPPILRMLILKNRAHQPVIQ
jgi:hypothetical protein